MPEADTIDRIKSRRVQVASLPPADSGRGFARLPDKLMDDLRKYVEAAPDEVISQVLDQSGYREALKGSNEEEDQERLANVEELITAAKQFAHEDESRTITDFLENITLASDVDGWDEQQDCVSIMTLHAAKGLEFPVVYMVAVEEGILPHQRRIDSHKKDQIEEERRLAFVGMTRAREELYLCHARLRDFRGQTLYAIPSTFIGELPEDVARIDQSDGARVAGTMDRCDCGRSSRPRKSSSAFAPARCRSGRSRPRRTRTSRSR